MPNKKTWSDQPDVVLDAPIVLSFSLEDRHLEIRKSGDHYYVTSGNIFGSQTVLAKDEAALWAVLRIATSKGTGASLPDGARILE